MYFFLGHPVEEGNDKWDDDLMDELERKFEELGEFNATLETSSDKDITLDKDKLKKDTIKLVVNQIYDKMTTLFNYARQRLAIKGAANIEEPIRNYDSFNLDDNGNLTFTYKIKLQLLGISTSIC